MTNEEYKGKKCNYCGKLVDECDIFYPFIERCDKCKHLLTEKQLDRFVELLSDSKISIKDDYRLIKIFIDKDSNKK